MLNNYLKTSWRNIVRHKVYTTINVFGLALGICACIVIYLITSYEFSFDRFHPDDQRIFRVVGELQRPGGEKIFLNSPVPDVAGFQNQIPGFESATGVHLYDGAVSIPDGKNAPKHFDNRIQGSYTSSTIITWPQYFDIFKYQWLKGNQDVLNQPFKVVLSEKRAHLYFGDIPLASMIGKTVIYDDSLRVTVAGIITDWTQNTDFGYTDFISISTATHSFLKNQISTEDWNSLSPHRSMAFVKLDKATTAAEVNNRFAGFIKDHVRLKNPGASLSMRLQALTDIHFTTEFHRGDDGDNFRKPYRPELYVLMGVALFILIIAVINFINLSTAQSVYRAKEIGVRKVMGSGKKSIMLQFLIETLVLTALAVTISAILVNPVLYLFRDYIPAGITFHLNRPTTLIFLTVLTLLTSFLAGFYPARVLSSYLPILSLKGISIQAGTDKINLRKALIVFQFSISLIFIIGALVIGKQIRYMHQADKGFNTDAIITMSNWADHGNKLAVFADNIKGISGVEKVILEGTPPMGFAQMIDRMKYKGKDEKDLEVSAHFGNEDFIPFYQMKLIAGRNMLHSDSLNELIVNETLARTIGFNNPKDAVGKILYGAKPLPIVGVVADFHTSSFHEIIQPTVIENVPQRKFSVAVKLAISENRTADVKVVLSQLERAWNKIFPDRPFGYDILNESIVQLYGQEKKTEWLVNVAMGITIFIACMGLFGLGMFTAQQKAKEIGIRKILGASVLNIAAMLTRDFVRLVMISFLIAFPVAWYFSNQWLLDFAYRTNVSWWIFILAGTSAIVITLITTSFQAIKAAITNPVEALRTE